MKLPCWIKHDYGRYGEPFTKIRNYYNKYNCYLYSVSTTFQKRECMTCGKIQNTIIESYTFDRTNE